MERFRDLKDSKSLNSTEKLVISDLYGVADWMINAFLFYRRFVWLGLFFPPIERGFGVCRGGFYDSCSGEFFLLFVFFCDCGCYYFVIQGESSSKLFEGEKILHEPQFKFSFL